MLLPNILALSSLLAVFSGVTAIASPEPGPADIELGKRLTPLPPLHNFKLRVWKRYRFDSPPPHIDGQLEIGVHGHAIYNKTKDYPGREYALVPPPGYVPEFPEETIPRIGRLFQRGTGKRGYLVPIGDPKKGLYAFKFSHRIPHNALYKEFTKQGRDCGGHCGGYDLRYKSKYGDPSSFYIVPHPKVPYVWLVQYANNWIADAPKNSHEVMFFLS